MYGRVQPYAKYTPCPWYLGTNDGTRAEYIGLITVVARYERGRGAQKQRGWEREGCVVSGRGTAGRPAAESFNKLGGSRYLADPVVWVAKSLPEQ